MLHVAWSMGLPHAPTGKDKVLILLDFLFGPVHALCIAHGNPIDCAIKLWPTFQPSPFGTCTAGRGASLALECRR